MNDNDPKAWMPRRTRGPAIALCALCIFSGTILVYGGVTFLSGFWSVLYILFGLGILVLTPFISRLLK